MAIGTNSKHLQINTTGALYCLLVCSAELRDIFRHTTDHDFLRLRIGIGHPGSKDAVTPYVLGRATSEQERLMREAISDAIDVLPQVLDGKLSNAMKALHTEKENGL